MTSAEHDKAFTRETINEVSAGKGGDFTVRFESGSFLGVRNPDGLPLPLNGSEAFLFGEGFGRPVRGFKSGGLVYFYETAAEFEERERRERYGATAREWVDRWDSGNSIWSVEMGGFGPGYEQAIQIAAVELVRHIIDTPYDCVAWIPGPADEQSATWESDRERIEKWALSEGSPLKGLGLSGAQYGAAVSLAVKVAVYGPEATIGSDEVKERRIQVSKHWPQAAEQPGADPG